MGKRINRAAACGRDGMTLIEVIIAMAVLSIMVVAFFALSGTTILGISNAGAKNQAIADANEMHDQIYYAITNAASTSEAETAIKALPGWKASASDVVSTVSTPQFYYQKTAASVEGVTVDGFIVTTVVYYQDGKFKVQQESFIYKSS